MPLLPFAILPLAYICNKFLSLDVFSERLKYAIIKTVYKKGNKIYRPISLLTSFSKIFKKPIYSRLHKYLCTNNILVKEQYGFRINSFTETVPYHHHHHTSFMQLSHLLTRSSLTYPEVSSKVYHESFCQLWSSISLPWVIYFEAFYLHVLSSFPFIPVICPKLVSFLY